MKKIIIAIVVLAVGFGAGFGVYKYKQNKDQQTNSTEEVAEADNDVVNAPVDDTPLTEEERKAFAKLYKEKGAELEQKVEVTDKEIDSYMAANDINYPQKKLIVTQSDGTESHIYIDDSEDLKDIKVGTQSEYGLVKEITDLSDADKREIVESIIHSNKVTNKLMQEIRNGNK